MVIVLLRIEVIQRELLQRMPEDASEDEEVIMPMGGYLRNPSDHG